MAFSKSILIHNRTLKAIAKILESSKPPEGEDKEAFFNFLENYCLADQLIIDPTVPPKIKAESRKIITDLGLTKKFNSFVESTSVDLKDTHYKAIQEGMANGKQLFLTMGGLPPAPRVTPVERADKFYQTILKLKHAPVNDRTAIAEEAYQSGLMGGKALIGLAAEENEDAFSFVLKLYEAKNLVLEDIHARIINVFRPFFLSISAADQGGLYAGKKEDLVKIDYLRRYIWQDVLKDLHKEVMQDLGPSERKLFDLPTLAPLVFARVRGRTNKKDVFKIADEVIAEQSTTKLLPLLNQIAVNFKEDGYEYKAEIDYLAEQIADATSRNGIPYVDEDDNEPMLMSVIWKILKRHNKILGSLEDITKYLWRIRPVGKDDQDQIERHAIGAFTNLYHRNKKSLVMTDEKINVKLYALWDR